MKPLALGVFEDLRRRRLLPVAILLLVALVAVPVLMLKKADPAPVGTSVPAVAAGTADGLPSPKEALAGDKPLVSLAVLKQSSDLDSFASKNPFKPMEQVSTGGAESAPAVAPAPVAPAPGAGGPPGGSPGGGLGGVSPGGSPSAPDGGSGGGGGGGGGGTPTKPAPPTNPPPATEPDKPQRKLTYALDLTFTSPRGEKSLRNVAKLRMLPNEASPLLVFLGIGTSNDKAVFLIDSSLTVESGEGDCKPSAANCATLALEPGQVGRFVDDQGRRYELGIDQIRLVSATAAAARVARSARAERARARTSNGPVRRFVPPVITDLLTGGQS